MVDSERQSVLEYTLRRMNSVAAVFDVRVQTVDCKQFQQFRELMELYIRSAQRAMDEGHDFVDEGIVLDENDQQELQKLTAQIFREANSESG